MTYLRAHVIVGKQPRDGWIGDLGDPGPRSRSRTLAGRWALFIYVCVAVQNNKRVYVIVYRTPESRGAPNRVWPERENSRRAYPSEFRLHPGRVYGNSDADSSGFTHGD